MKRILVKSLVKAPIQEDIERHESLNPKLFLDGKMRPEVREKALEVVAEFIKLLEVGETPIKFAVKDIILTGSNASYNYTKDSDVDIHIVADMSQIDNKDNLYAIIYDAYKSLFNRKYEFTFYGIPVEIYVETADTPTVSNGIYSIKDDKWVKEPVLQDIPPVDEKAIADYIKPWEDDYNQLVDNIKNNVVDETMIDNFVTKLYKIRQKGLRSGGEYSKENFLFKELRNKGYLKNLKDLKDELIAKRLTLEKLGK